jgi:hypothetical protein
MKEMEFATLILPQKFSFSTAALTGAHAKVQHEKNEGIPHQGCVAGNR